MQSFSLIVLGLLVVAALAAGESDLEALLKLKKGFEKDPSGQALVSWDSKSFAANGCPQNWAGIICSNGYVTSISLNGLGLAGEFHFPAISSLKLLRNLSISNNQFTGTILGIESIGLLEFLDLSCNSFHGQVPSGFTSLRNLVLVNLSSNNFEGKLPSGIGNFVELKYLDLRGNAFSGDIMHVISQLGSVVHVDLSSNQFSGALDLGIGKSIFVSTIQYLNVSHNSVTGELFAHDGMPYFDNLEAFDASNNQLVGTIPSFNFVVSLRILQLGGNQLSGSLPEALLQESSMVLSELDLSLNQLEGPIGIITSATLKKLNLSSNKLSGSLPAKVGHCALIDLSNNMLSGNLSRIWSWGNYVENIHLSSNALTGTLPDHTYQFLRLVSLEISNNSLEGSLPPVLGTYPELKVVDLSLNKLNGPLLPSLFTSTKLTDLNLSANNLTGPIPLQETTSITGDTSSRNLSLVSLDLSHNSLTGHLPQELSRFHDLIYLSLSNNHFDGIIPINLPAALKAFNVSYNNLSGVIPENLRRFPDTAFHPGNSLLMTPFTLTSPANVPNLALGKSHLKSTVRIAIIAVVVGAIAILALVTIMIYYRAHRPEHQRKLKETGDEKGVRHVASSLIHTSEPGTVADPPLTSSNLLNQASSSIFASAHEQGITSSERTKDLGLPYHLQKMDAEAISPSATITSSSNVSPHENRHWSENPCTLISSSPDELAGDLHLFGSSLLFTVQDLSHAPSEVYGRSCHGILYKVELHSGHVLAVKRLREGIAKGKKEFAREAKKLGNIKHPNLVSLQGYYWGPMEHAKLIISNYINAKCLAQYLREREPRKLPHLSLGDRLKVAIDVASCLNYLHSERAIPHGNLKSTNILLESPYSNVLLTDYSLHRIMNQVGTADQVLDAGASGYRPPEFANSSRPCPSLKSDVYAFGVVLLELLTGRRSGEIASRNSAVIDLTDWVRFLAAENRSNECFDGLILGVHADCAPTGLFDMLQVALRCILPATERPDMKSIFEDLSSIVL